MMTLYKTIAVGMVAVVILVGLTLGMLVLAGVDLNQPSCNCSNSKKPTIIFIEIKDGKGTCTCFSNSKIKKPRCEVLYTTPDI